MSDELRGRPKGTLDFLPPESEHKRWVEDAFGHLANVYGFRLVETPLFEHSEVFVKSSGEASDVVTKEMYSFADKAGRSLTLRPEGTPGVVRAALESSLRLPCRLYYAGPYFRYSRPQKGRYRQFHQLGAEALGEAAPAVDAEIILFGAEFFALVGIHDCLVKVNSIGCVACRPDYRRKLVEFLSARLDSLCDDCRARVSVNPLRVLDCKVETCRAAVAEAPRPRAHLCPECDAHFNAVLDTLARRNLRFEVDDRLVRGLDYYNRTTFEYVSGALGAQDSLGGGGRYDYLVKAMGGPDAPAIGLAIGVERTMLVSQPPPRIGRRRLCWVAWFSDAERDHAVELADRLRAAGVPAQMDFDARGIKRQFRTADAAGAACCLVVGPDELARGVYTLKDLGAGTQLEVAANCAIEEVRAVFRD
jgi:histidyl-tRNA synthetase